MRAIFAAIVLAIVALSWAEVSPGAAQPADTILLNGKVVTLDTRGTLGHESPSILVRGSPPGRPSSRTVHGQQHDPERQGKECPPGKCEPASLHFELLS